jgi:uncharacterized OB-fold protein
MTEAVDTGKPAPEMTTTSRPYWEAATRDELSIPWCPRCERFFMWPAPWCPHCWYVEPTWRHASGSARVIACTAVHQAPLEAYQRETPYCLAVVRLDEGPQLMTNIVGCAAGDVSVGMPVRVDFERREGGVKVPVFRPAQLS